MKKIFSQTLSPSFAISILALAVALGGGAAYATSRAIPQATITCVKITHFQHGWKNAPTNIFGPFPKVQACRDSLGYVHLEGLLTGGSPSQSTAFVLPRGFRPRFNHAYAVAAGTGAPSAAEDVDLFSNGAVFVNGTLDPVALDGITFHRGG